MVVTLETIYLKMLIYLLKNELEQSLYQTITRFEPRVEVLVIDVQFEDLGIKLKIDFRIKNTNRQLTLATLVKRTA
jgi:predicted component of type VI protein secretion system